jgi:hypothetical protein
MTTSLTTTTAAVRAVSARKVYGTAETAVIALDDVTLSIPGGSSPR